MARVATSRAGNEPDERLGAVDRRQVRRPRSTRRGRRFSGAVAASRLVLPGRRDQTGGGRLSRTSARMSRRAAVGGGVRADDQSVFEDGAGHRLDDVG